MSKILYTKFIIAAVSLPAFLQAATDEKESVYLNQSGTDSGAVSFAYSGSYDSRYFSEGRDALDGEPLLANSLEIGWGFLGCGIWYGNSTESDYDELQVGLSATQSFGNVEISAGFTYFEFPFEDANDREVGICIVVSEMPFQTELGVDAYYSFEAEGYFAEVCVSREILSLDAISASVSGIFGNNQGYVTDGHDGANHFAVALDAEIPLAGAFAIGMQVTYSWALDRDMQLEGDQQLINFLHGGIGLSWEY